MSEHWCSSCSENKPADEFYADRVRGGLQRYCKTCTHKARRRSHGSKARRRHGQDIVAVTVGLSRPTRQALRTTAEARGETQSQIVERAVSRELRHLWEGQRA